MSEMRILRTADDVDEQVLSGIDETLDWFIDEPRIDWDEFIDRLARDGNLASPPFDIESYDNPAVRKIQRIAREWRRT